MRNEPNQPLQILRGRLLVSCQASEQDAFNSPDSMARFARAAVDGGAAGIRANGPRDIRAIRQSVDVPVIGIEKRMMPDGRILITPALEDAARLVDAGAGAVAIDCTARGQKFGALDRLRRIRETLAVPVLADIATEDEASQAAEAGADFVLSTMRGYSEDTAHIRTFQPHFIAALVSRLKIPVIAEGQINLPAEAAAAIDAGAFAVIVGTAITRPHEITRRFVSAVTRRRNPVIGIDLGGSNTKSGIVAPDGVLLDSSVVATPARASQQELLAHIGGIAEHWQASAATPPVAIGIATAGWVDTDSGAVTYATGNLPSWTGAPIRAFLEQLTGLPVAVENDANAAALGEARFGTGRGFDPLICLTLGTGVGGGCVAGGRLLRGANGMANALGHITVEPRGLPCTCGRRGCLEVYANAAALEREGIPVVARHLARGCAQIVHTMDPQMIVLAGGVIEYNPGLLAAMESHLAAEVFAFDRRRLRIAASSLRSMAGVVGAGALCLTG